MSKRSSLCTQSGTVVCGMDQVVRKTTNSHTNKKKPTVSSARLHLFTAVQCFPAPVKNTSMDFGLWFSLLCQFFLYIGDDSNGHLGGFAISTSCSTEGEMELTAGPLQCLGTLHGTDRAWAHVNLFNLAQASFVKRARGWTWLSSH